MGTLDCQDFWVCDTGIIFVYGKMVQVEPNEQARLLNITKNFILNNVNTKYSKIM